MGFKPGPPIDEPAAYEELLQERLLANPSMQHLPRDDREWAAFIIELQKWIRSETGLFTPTMTGFSSAPGDGSGNDASVWWQRFGQIVFCEFYIGTATSNATFFRITNLPEEITPRDNQHVLIRGLEDNGSLLTVGSCTVRSDNAIYFHTNDVGSGTWTNTGDKGFNGTGGQQSIIYMLRQPNKA